MKNIILSSFIVFSFVLSSSKIFGQGTCTAIASGIWDEASTWNCDAPASYPDLTITVINIGQPYRVTIDGVEGAFPPPIFPPPLLEVIINLDGELYFDGDLAALLLSEDSQIILSSTGKITSNALADFIFIGGNLTWSGIFDPNVTGPGTMDKDTRNGALPIELLSFSSTLAGEVVNISWATASETDNDFFTIERSEDGVNWSTIAEVPGAGTTSEQKNYELTDYNPIPGLSYYHLKQTDYDGQFEYFPSTVVLYEPDDLFKAFPNPTTNILNITTSSDLSNASISVKNLNGQTLQVGESTSSHQTAIDVSNLPIGVYLLEIVFPESVISKRIVKK